MFVDPLGLASFIFTSKEMYDQAEARKAVYEKKYGTECYVITVNSAEMFAKRWNDYFSNYFAGEEIEAIEIISHGSAEGPPGKTGDGTANATGFLYFTDDKPKNNRLYARSYGGMKQGDVSITSLESIQTKVEEFNIEGCNSANPDIYNIVYGFMQKVDAKIYTGFDGGSQWSWEMRDHTRGNGEYGRTAAHPFNPEYYVSKFQYTWWKYVDKNSDGSPVRERTGRRWFHTT